MSELIGGWVAGLTATLIREGINKHRAREIAQGYWEAYCKDDAEAEAEVERLKEDYHNACKTVVQVHAAATGRPGEGPFLGVVEDVAAVRAERDALQAEVERLR